MVDGRLLVLVGSQYRSHFATIHNTVVDSSAERDSSALRGQDHYVLITSADHAGGVGFVDQSDIGTIDYLVATNLWTFLWFLLHRDGGDRRWPLDRNQVIAHDPAMATVPPDLQPWRAHG